MKLILFSILIFSSVVHANMNQFIDLLSSPQNLAIEIPFCPPPTEIKDYFETDEKVEGMKKVSCAPPMEDREFFRRIHYANCRNRFGDTGFNCVESDEKKVEERLNNLELLKKIADYTRAKFISSKESLASECCAGKAHCLQRFNAIELNLVSSSKVEAQYESDTAARNSKRNTIMITSAKLVSAYNTENIDRVLYAELGHACQFAMLAEDEELYREFTTPNKRCEATSGLLMFKEGLGDEVSKCLIDEIKTQINEIPVEKRSQYCFGKWYREAFSDMKFRKHYTSVYHWTYDMSRRSQYTNYGSTIRYLKCVLPPDFKKQICSQ